MNGGPTSSSTDNKPVLFTSHAAFDKEIAHFLKEVLQRTFEGLEVFVSSDPEDLPTGDPWVEKILEALSKAKLIVVLGTDRGLGRKWVWFEAGAGWDRRRQIVTCCVGKMRKDKLPPPFSLYTARNLDEEEDCREFFKLIQIEFGIAPQSTDLAGLCKTLIRLDVRAEERFRVTLQEREDSSFHDAQRQSLEGKLIGSDVCVRDLLRYLLLNGESDGHHVYAAANFQDTHVGQYLDTAVGSGLVVMRIERAGTGMELSRHWSVNPEFATRLRAILFPRAQAEGSPKFKL